MTQEYLDRLSGVDSGDSWNLHRIGVKDRPRDGKGVHVFIFDTGIRGSHKEFDGRVVPTLDFTVTAKGLLCEGDHSCAQDRNGHGTHCAGTVGGRNVGVAPGAKLHAVKVLDDQGSGDTTWQLAALDWLTTQNFQERPAVVSMSLTAQGRFPAFKLFIDAAIATGVVVVTAAGNSDDDACKFSPAYLTSVITVGATDSSDTRSYFSNYGSCTNIWAPGSEIRSAAHGDNVGFSTESGTSMACPLVSGAAALVLEENPTMSATMVQEVLQNRSESNAIWDLTSGDNNKLLSISDLAVGPPTAALGMSRYTARLTMIGALAGGVVLVMGCLVGSAMFRN